MIFYFLFLDFFFVWGALLGSAGCLKKATKTPNAGHPFIVFSYNHQDSYKRTLLSIF
jgi:hypothetical protein